MKRQPTQANAFQRIRDNARAAEQAQPANPIWSPHLYGRERSLRELERVKEKLAEPEPEVSDREAGVIAESYSEVEREIAARLAMPENPHAEPQRELTLADLADAETAKHRLKFVDNENEGSE